MQKTVVLLKPDCLERGLVGEIIGRFEKKGLKLAGLKMLRLSDKILDKHYAHHVGKPFFKSLKEFMKSTPVVALLLSGADAVEVVRKMTGATNGRDADFGTIRGDLSISQSNNLIHVSDSAESAKIEEERFFEKGEIFEWERLLEKAVYGEDELKT